MAPASLGPWRTCPCLTRAFIVYMLVLLSGMSLSSSASFASSSETGGISSCQWPSAEFPSQESRLTSTEHLASEVIKDVVLTPVTIANGSQFNLAAHIFMAQTAGLTEGADDAVLELCAHRQDIVLVLLHGATYDAQYWDAETVDNHPYSFARHFAKLCYTVLALDELGVGQSDSPDGYSLNIADHVLSLGQILESLRTDHNPFRHRAFKHVVLLGHSFGATLARATLADFPDSADLLILTASSLGHEPTLPELGFLLTVNPGPYLTLPTEGPRGNMRKIFLYNVSVAPAMVEYDRTKLASLFPRATFIELGRLFAYRRSLESRETQSVIEMYRTDKVKIPVFIQCGDHDVFASVEACLQGPAFFPNSPEVFTDLLTDMGHSFNLHINNLLGWANIARYMGEKYPLERCTI